jgi:hypothetical protein
MQSKMIGGSSRKTLRRWRSPCRQELAGVVLGLAEVFVGVELHALGGSVLIDPLPRRRITVERHQDLHQGVHVGLGELTPCQHLAAERVLFDLTHDDDPVDDVAFALEGQAVAVEGLLSSTSARQ